MSVGTGGSAARPLLRATVGPLAAAVIVHHLGSDIEERAAGYERTGPGGAQVAEELRAAVAEMRESARLRNRPHTGYGTAEVPQTRGVARSERLRGADEMLSVGQVATRVGLSERRVRTLCEDGQLVATRLPTTGRPYGIDPVSVQVFEDERRRA